MKYALEFLKLLEKMRSPMLDAVIQLVTRLGEEVIVLGVICILYWCVNKNSAYRLGLIFFISGILVQGLKVTFRVERPWVLEPTLSPLESAIPAATGYSFPSGHTQGATALYGYFAATSDKKTRNGKILFTVMLLLIALVGFSRMYLGVHTPFDVGVSIIATAISIFAVLRLWDKLCLPSADMALAIALGLASVLLCVYSFIMYKTGLVPLEQIQDCFKSGGAGFGFAIGYYIERKYLKFSVKTDKLWQQIVKVAVGVGGALALKSLPKLIAEGNLAIDFSRYFLTVLWVIVLYPIIFSKLLKTDCEKITK